jgi:DNA-binding beta-propeller fold protein YncE
MVRLLVVVVAALLIFSAADSATLELEGKIALGDVRGRIDHLSFDGKRQRLFVAELGNNTIGVVDIGVCKTVRTITGLDEPQGLAYFDVTDTVYAANGGDGTLHLFSGEDLKPGDVIKLGSDADNVRIDRAKKQIIVGYGSGALAVIDAETRKIVATISLKAHPESFQLNPSGSRIYVNVPSAREIAVVDRTTSKQVAAWPTKDLVSNYPLALDSESQRALAVFRRPAAVGIFSWNDGRHIGTVDVCGDSDDAFVDTKRQRIYVICGDGSIDVLKQDGDSYRQIGRIKTVDGARTGLFAADADRLFVAVRARSGEPAAIWIFRPID